MALKRCSVVMRWSFSKVPRDCFSPCNSCTASALQRGNWKGHLLEAGQDELCIRLQFSVRFRVALCIGVDLRCELLLHGISQCGLPRVI